MTYSPPPPPELPSNRPPASSPAEQPAPAQNPPTAYPASYPPAGYPPAAYYAPADPGYPPPYGAYPPVPGQPQPVPTGSSGCRWGCIAVLLTMFAAAVLVGAVLLNILTSGVNTFGGIGTTIGNILGTWADAFNPPHRTIVLPQVERLQKLADLTTVKFNYAGVVTVKQDMPGVLSALYGNEQTLVAVVSVRAGIDFQSLTADDVLYDADTNTLTLTLPAPVLQECFMDDSKSYVVENRTGIFVGASPALNDEARRYAIQQFRDQALEENILQEAQKEGDTVVRDFMAVLNPSADAPALQITFAPPDLNTVAPVTCQ